jgi:hypothetical protein
VKSPPKQEDVKPMAHERELTTKLLSKGASFRLIVTGQIGVKEIERLIKKRELDKEILAAPDRQATIYQPVKKRGRQLRRPLPGTKVDWVDF